MLFPLSPDSNTPDEILISERINEGGIFFDKEERVLIKYIHDFRNNEWLAYIFNKELSSWQSLWPPCPSQKEVRLIALEYAGVDE